MRKQNSTALPFVTLAMMVLFAAAILFWNRFAVECSAPTDVTGTYFMVNTDQASIQSYPDPLDLTQLREKDVLRSGRFPVLVTDYPEWKGSYALNPTNRKAPGSLILSNEKDQELTFTVKTCKGITTLESVNLIPVLTYNDAPLTVMDIDEDSDM